MTNIKCSSCNSLIIKYNYQKQVGGSDTTRKERELLGLEEDNLQQLYCHPPDNTWYGCIMCNTEFDENGQEYEIRKMYPFCKSPSGQID